MCCFLQASSWSQPALTSGASESLALLLLHAMPRDITMESCSCHQSTSLLLSRGFISQSCSAVEKQAQYMYVTLNQSCLASAMGWLGLHVCTNVIIISWICTIGSQCITNYELEQVPERTTQTHRKLSQMTSVGFVIRARPKYYRSWSSLDSGLLERLSCQGEQTTP